MNIKNNTSCIEEILCLLPHRFPFILVDRVLYFEKWKFLRAVKNISLNEPFFQGHFPERPIFPGVLILESMAQATGILSFKSSGKLSRGEFYYFAAISEARFKKTIRPGDQMIIEVEFIKERCKIFKFKGVAKVDDEIRCEALIVCARRKEN